MIIYNYITTNKINNKQYVGMHCADSINDAYQKGDRVHFPAIDSPVYESKINANVWSPTAYPEGWLLIP